MASSSRHESPPAEQVEEINILLVGESGVGKTTFINSCFNYLKYATLKDVLHGELQVLIPAKINMEDMHYEQKSFELKVTYKPEIILEEVLEDAVAGTRDVHTYIFYISVHNKKYRVKFLDTPGMGDERGTAQDEKNCDLILTYLSQLKEIHGFCILLKPTNSRLDVFMNYCMVQILSRLESSAVKNVCFVFTNTRGQNFTPGHTYTPLKKLLEQIKEHNKLDIPFNRQNMFCFDNEPFRYVAAIQNGVELQPFIYRNTEDSWNQSCGEFWRMLYYISQLKPHDLKKTISVNDARTMASHLAQPATEIVQLIQDNITRMEQHTAELSQTMLKKEELMAKMHTPSIEIGVTQLEYPHTVCVNSNCTAVYEVNGIRKFHYKQKCCSQCLVSFITPNIVGNVALYACSAFNWSGQCRECDHSLSFHKQIYYETEIYEKEVDESIIPVVNSVEELVKLKEALIVSIGDRTQEFQKERQYILQSCAVLDEYLQRNTITPVGNPVEDYLKYQIARETSCGRDEDDKTVKNLRNLLAEYEKEKATAQVVRPGRQEDITPEDIQAIKHRLMSLPHFGPKIKRLYDFHQAGAKKAFKKREKKVKGGMGQFFTKFQDLFNLGNAAIQLGLIPSRKNF